MKERVKNLVLVDAKTPNQIAIGGAIKELELGNPLLNTVLFSVIGEVLPYDNLSVKPMRRFPACLPRMQT